MPNKFNNQLDFGGVDISALPDKISNISASDCNGIDFSLPGTIKTTGAGVSVGATTTDLGYEVGDMYVFKKAFGTKQEIIIRTAKRTSDSTMRIQWFNNDLTLGNYGRWEDLYDTALSTSAKLTFAPVNGDNGEKINRLIIGINNTSVPLVWNGATAKVTNWGSNQIITNSSNLLLEGFEDHAHKSNEIMVNGTLYTYTGISGGTFTGVTPDPTTTPPNLSDGITQNADDELMLEASTLNATHISFANTNEVIRTSFTWESQNFSIGKKIYISGATETSNNGVFTIANITTTSFTGDTLVLEETTLTTEAAGASVSVTAGAPKGSIVHSAQGKLWLSGVQGAESKVYYSYTGIATLFAITTAGGLSSGGTFDLVENGGAVTALYSTGKNKIIVHKKDSITLYTRDTDTSGNVIESFDIVSSGVGVGAVNQNSITSYGKTTFFLTNGGEIKTMEQSIYSTETFTFGNIGNAVKNLILTALQTNPYMVYDSKLNRLVLSIRSYLDEDDSTTSTTNHLIYIYVSVGPNGYEYKPSFHEIKSFDTHFDVPIVITSNQTSINGTIVYLPYFLNTYLLGKDIQSSQAVRSSNDVLSKNYYITNEKVFGEPAMGKSFSIINFDGYLYADTIIKFTVIYGVNGKDGTKSYFINKDSISVADTKTVDTDYNILGKNSINRNFNQNGLKDSYYFKLPLHIDINKSDRYQIRIETWNQSMANTFWAINNVSTNAVLNDVNMNELVNQNIAEIDGVGEMIVNDTNQVSKDFYIS